MQKTNKTAVAASVVDDLLGSMTLAEKAGQMTQLTLAAVSDGDRLDPKKLLDLVGERAIGSVLNVRSAALSLSQWRSTIREIQQVAVRETRLGIPVLFGIDSVHGANYLSEGTIFPHNIALAATWNEALVEEVGRITARETLASGIPWIFSPVLDMGRQPLWSRFGETFGEDPHVVSTLGRSLIAGIETEGVAACAKHFVGYGTPNTGKDRTSASIPPHELFDIHVPPFEAAIQAGVRSIMINSGELNGEAVHASRRLLHDLLRTRLGFGGVTVTDWEDIIKLHLVHRVADSQLAATELAIKAGIDMSMTPYTTDFIDHVVRLVDEGRLSERRIDESVRRILAMKESLGLFQDPVPGEGIEVGGEEAKRINLTAARQAVTLLKNEGELLPLNGGERVLVCGPAAADVTPLGGPWTFTWQGADRHEYPLDARTLSDEVVSRVSPDRASVLAGASWTDRDRLDEVVLAAADADVVIVCVGEQPSVEKPGDIDDLRLPAAQLELVRSVATTGVPVVLVLLQARPRVLADAVDRADAVLLGYHAGLAGAEAIADVLFGAVNPSGRLPFSYPRHVNDVVTYDHRPSHRLSRSYGLSRDVQLDAVDPLFAFGHGLSYTTFQYSDLRVSDAVLAVGSRVEVSVTVTNSGKREGAEVVQLFTRDEFASVSPRFEVLAAFKRVILAPGDSEEVHFEIAAESLSFADLEGNRTLESGFHQVRIGPLIHRFYLDG